MLTNTFCHLSGVGERTERGLWSAGVHSWDAPWPAAGVRLPRAVRETWPQQMQESASHHANRNPAYFAAKLPANQQWRLYRDFQDSCAFIDIETDGSYWPGAITTIALYDGQILRHYVRGHNLNAFLGDVQDYRLLVTYNGKSFDVPFIERQFGVRLPQAHLDLRYPLASLGLKGGLKGCERQVGIARPGLDGVDGFVAVLLWEEYRRGGNAKALETLLAYNAQDAVSLHALAVHAHNEKVRATPFAESQMLPVPLLPPVPFEADPAIVERVFRQRLGAGMPFSAWSHSV